MIMPWLLVVIVVTLISKLVWSRRRLRELASRIPGLPGSTLPLIGDALKLLGGGEKIFQLIEEIGFKNGSTCRVWIGPKLFVVITDPEDTKIVLNKKEFQNRDINVTRSVSAFLGDGLITNRDETWKKHRKIITPAFHLNILAQYIDTFTKFSKILVKRLEKFADGNNFDVFSFVGLCNLDMTSETTSGVDSKLQIQNKFTFLECFERGLSLIRDKVFMPWLLIDMVLNLTQRGKEQKEIQKIMRDEMETVVIQKIQEYHDSRKQGKFVDSEKPKPTFLNIILKVSESLGEVLTYSEIKDEVFTIFAAAQDTTAIANSFTLIMLALYPDHQEKVVQELNAIFGEDEDRPVTMDDLRQMEYLERVIKETIRLYPSAPLMPREITEEVKLNTCTLPAGCTAVVFCYGTHRDPRIFPEPDQFDPDRFLPDRVQARHPYSFLGFGAGPRMCIGYRYAMLSMKTLLSTVLRSYRVLPACSRQDLERLDVGMDLKPFCGFHIKMLPREPVS